MSLKNAIQSLSSALGLSSYEAEQAIMRISQLPERVYPNPGDVIEHFEDGKFEVIQSNQVPLTEKEKREIMAAYRMQISDSMGSIGILTNSKPEFIPFKPSPCNCRNCGAPEFKNNICQYCKTERQ